MTDKQVIHAQNRLICVICHSCEEHFPIRLAAFVEVMSLFSQEAEEPVGWVCEECLLDETKGEQDVSH